MNSSFRSRVSSWSVAALIAVVATVTTPAQSHAQSTDVEVSRTPIVSAIFGPARHLADFAGELRLIKLASGKYRYTAIAQGRSLDRIAFGKITYSTADFSSTTQPPAVPTDLLPVTGVLDYTDPRQDPGNVRPFREALKGDLFLQRGVASISPSRPYDPPYLRAQTTHVK